MGANEVIANWVGDYCSSTAFVDHPSPVRQHASQVLRVLLQGACARAGVTPADLEERHLKPALLEDVARLDLPSVAHAGVPNLCAAFFAQLQSDGRMAGGRQLGLYLRALRKPYLAATKGSVETIRGPETKLGRNDPCPCGSGSKYKKCCMKLG